MIFARAWDCGGRNRGTARQWRRILAALLTIAALVPAAGAATLETATASLPAAALAGLPDADTFHPYSACTGAGGSASPTRPAVDRPLCGAALAPPARELRINRADAFFSLGLAGDSSQQFGEVRSQLGFRHLMEAGALAGWKLGGDVQLGRTAFATLEAPLDEQLHLSLGRDLAGWKMGVRLGATRLATGDPALASQTLSFAGDVSRGFPGASPGEQHRLTLRLEQDSTATGAWGWEQRTSQASLGYAYRQGAGSIGADVALSRYDAAGVEGQSSARSEIKFRHPF